MAIRVIKRRQTYLRSDGDTEKWIVGTKMRRVGTGWDEWTIIDRFRKGDKHPMLTLLTEKEYVFNEYVMYWEAKIRVMDFGTNHPCEPNRIAVPLQVGKSCYKVKQIKVGGESESETLIWFAPNIGIVKEGYNGETILELDSYKIVKQKK